MDDGKLLISISLDDCLPVVKSPDASEGQRVIWGFIANWLSDGQLPVLAA